MNNLVEIKYETSSRYPKVVINGEEITRFTSLSAYIYDDIFRWANVFFELMDGDIAERYRVLLTGHPYQALVLRAASEKSEFCEGVDFINYASSISIKDKYAFACHLQNSVGEKAESLTFRTNAPDVFSSYASDQLVFTTEGDSNYCLATSEEEAEAMAGKYCIILSDKTEVVKKANNVYFFFVDSSDLSVALDYFVSYHLRLILISDVLSNTSKYTMDPKTALEFEAYTQEEYRVWAEKLPDQLDEGYTVDWNFEVFPSCFPAEKITVVSSDYNVVAYENGKLVAKGRGDATVRIVDSKGKEYFSQKVTVTYHNYATNITIILPKTTMLIGETLKFRTVVSPINAEDMDQITYTVSDERVAVLTNKDELYAISSGRVCLTVSTPRVSSKVYVKIPARACDVQLSSEGELTLPFSAEATIYGAAIPPNAVPLPDLMWSIERGSNAINIVRADNQKCVIRSCTAGRAVLVCRLKDTTIQKKLIVTVPKAKACYIATAVYGSYDCPEVWTLRRYRDEYLDAHIWGRLFIKCYYALGPTVVKIFGKNRLFNAFWHRYLDHKVLKLKKKGYDSTPYADKEF